ncbi:MAG TPA: FAD-binding oxidoreductase [Longimicrobiales bacterium]|nr:FAD-binding oxidoreductase [Longimicrobiales bacterium]
MTLPLPPAVDSMWAATAGPYTPGPALQEDTTVDVAIIGGGYTGLTTAYELRRADPGLSVAVLEAREIGYGSSGRNGSFAMTVVGLGFAATALVKGKDFLVRAHRYMMRAVDTLDELIEREGLDCDKIRPGFLRVATTESYLRKVRKEVELMNGLGFDDIHFLDRAEVAERVRSPLHLGALWEPRLVLVHPLKLVRAEKELAIRYGARVFENTPVLRVERGERFRLKTPNGTVSAAKVVFATNAYSHLFPELRRKQVPAFTHMMATEPLTPEQLEPIGWSGREGLEDARNLIHHYRLTADNRITMGGGPVGFTVANSLFGDESPAAWEEVESHFRVTFPHLRDVRFSHRWGGPFSVTLDLTPAIGWLGDRRAVFSLGCIGHGVSMTHLNAQTLRDMILERETELTESPFVGRRVLPWPPEPLRLALGLAMRSYLRAEDWAKEGEVRKAKERVAEDGPRPVGAGGTS